MIANRVRSLVLSALVGVASLTSAPSVDATLAPPCGDLQNAEGPWDYRSATPKLRTLIEHYHFTASVATLTKGESSSLGADISYTLRAFPNHPRALMAIAELARRQRRDPPIGSPYTVQCWFARAIEFRPDDAQVRTIVGIELLKDQHRAQAIEELRKAIALAPDNANAHYNLGLAYFEDRQFDEALTEAKTAYTLGFPLPGLRDMLQREHRWH